jgi:ribonuclease HI
MKGKEIVEVYCDGSSNNNKKEEGGGIGIYMKYGEYEKRVAEYIPPPANSSKCEVMALLRALQIAKVGFHYKIHSDSEYCVKTFNEWLGNWINKGILYQKAYYLLWEQISCLKQKHEYNGSTIEVIWIKGHVGIEGNEIVDKLANIGRLNEK